MGEIWGVNTILIEIMVSGMYIWAKTYQIIKYVQFIVSQLYLKITFFFKE